LILFAALFGLRAFWEWIAKTLPAPVRRIVDLALILFGAVLAGSWWPQTSIPQRSFDNMVEFGAAIPALTAYMLRREPGLARFSLAVVVFSFFSGCAQGISRCILGAPATFVMLGELGRDEAFDRSWTMGSLLLMGLFAILFTSKFWVG
jgi:hypothetical protein